MGHREKGTVGPREKEKNTSLLQKVYYFCSKKATRFEILPGFGLSETEEGVEVTLVPAEVDGSGVPATEVATVDVDVYEVEADEYAVVLLLVLKLRRARGSLRVPSKKGWSGCRICGTSC